VADLERRHQDLGARLADLSLIVAAAGKTVRRQVKLR